MHAYNKKTKSFPLVTGTQACGLLRFIVHMPAALIKNMTIVYSFKKDKYEAQDQ